jgi:CheY-like chemotaxis protein
MLSGKTRVLYIEDDIEDVELLKHVLLECESELEITHFSNGEAALDYLEKAKEFNRFPDIIFLDINMSRMNGKETLVCIKADKRMARLPIAILSTSTSDADKDYFRKLNIPYISKQGDLDSFERSILSVLKPLLQLNPV